MGSMGRCVSIIAYNVNSSPGVVPAGLLVVGPAVQAAERRTGGAGAGRRAGFGPLLRAFRVTLPSSPFYVGLDAVLLVSIWFLFCWFPFAVWGAIGYCYIGVPAGFTRSRRYGYSSPARVVIMRWYVLYTLAAFNRLISAVRGSRWAGAGAIGWRLLGLRGVGSGRSWAAGKI